MGEFRINIETRTYFDDLYDVWDPKQYVSHQLPCKKYKRHM